MPNNYVASQGGTRVWPPKPRLIDILILGLLIIDTILLIKLNNELEESKFESKNLQPGKENLGEENIVL